MATKPTLVLGGTGKTGRRVVERLAAQGIPTRLGSRSGAPPFDWEDRATWAPALQDVGSVYVSYYPDLAVPGAVETVGPFADADDIADVAVAALTKDGHIGQLYELTGPRLLTFAEAVDEIANASGREIRYVPVSIEEHAAAAAEQGVPGDVIDLLTYLFSEILDGRNARLTDGVQRAIGREPRDFGEFARDAAATGV